MSAGGPPDGGQRRAGVRSRGLPRGAPARRGRGARALSALGDRAPAGHPRGDAVQRLRGRQASPPHPGDRGGRGGRGPDGRRHAHRLLLRADPHVLPGPRRPARHGRRRLPSRAPHEPQGLRRGDRGARRGRAPDSRARPGRRQLRPGQGGARGVSPGPRRDHRRGRHRRDGRGPGGGRPVGGEGGPGRDARLHPHAEDRRPDPGRPPVGRPPGRRLGARAGGAHGVRGPDRPHLPDRRRHPRRRGLAGDARQDGGEGRAAAEDHLPGAPRPRGIEGAGRGPDAGGPRRPGGPSGRRPSRFAPWPISS